MPNQGSDRVANAKTFYGVWEFVIQLTGALLWGRQAATLVFRLMRSMVFRVNDEGVSVSEYLQA
jgi:hypothetical protein